MVYFLLIMGKTVMFTPSTKKKKKVLQHGKTKHQLQLLGYEGEKKPSTIKSLTRIQMTL